MSGGRDFPSAEHAARTVVFSRSEPDTICSVFCPFSDITRHFPGSCGKPVSKQFYFVIGRYAHFVIITVI